MEAAGFDVTSSVHVTKKGAFRSLANSLIDILE